MEYLSVFSEAFVPMTILSTPSDPLLNVQFTSWLGNATASHSNEAELPSMMTSSDGGLTILGFPKKLRNVVLSDLQSAHL